MTRPAHLLLVLVVAASASVRADEGVEFFEEKIRPVLVKHCLECHSSASDEPKGDLLVDFRDGLRKGGETGAAIVPGKPSESLLLDALRYEQFEMPPKKQLPESVIADFERWIRAGAVDPRDHPPSPTDAAASTWKAQLVERGKWWSLQPLKRVLPPNIRDSIWSKEPVDRFVRSALDKAGLTPAKPVRADIVMRRLAFVLTGLPPTPEQVAKFAQINDKNADAALVQFVDELLESPHFGERFARHWMDVVRYTDTYGYEWDNPAKGSWEYRDYLIRAFNDDVGFDQLIREQIAGDLLTKPRINKGAGVNESLIGPMFFHLGEHRHGDSLVFNGVHQEMVNNKIDAFSKAFLAMTVACARCHDHKLDAISQADYYALAGVFMSPRWTARSIDAPGKNDQSITELSRLRGEIRSRLSKLWLSQSGPLSSGLTLQEWAAENRAMLKDAKIDDVAWPVAQLLGNMPKPQDAPASDDAAERADKPGDAIAKTWSRLKSQWTTARESRQKANAGRFTVLADFAAPGLPDGWSMDGDGIANGFVTCGEPRISLSGDAVLAELLPRGYHTHALSSKLAGAIRLPAQDKTAGRQLSLKLAGGEWAGWMVVPQNAFQTEPLTFLDGSVPLQWKTLADRGVKPEHGITRMLPEVMTASLHANFPPRTGLARAGKATLAHNDDGLNKRSWFSLTGIVAHDSGTAPQDTLEHLDRLFNDEPPKSTPDAWRKTASWFTAALKRWAANESTAADVKLINWLLKHKLIVNEQEIDAEIATLVGRYREIESRIDYPRSAISMDERGVEPLDYRLNARGDVYQNGPEIRRSFLEVFAGRHGVAKSDTSGRLELAEYLSSRKNTQTARVYVNRVWQAVFGQGIVATPNDFGKLGARPSHPELLDWLANKFMEDGWSTKKLVRRLVLSQTFRQEGKVTQAASDLDPQNHLLHHYPTRRLEAEALRDSLLAVSGRLDSKQFGPPINPPRLVDDGAKRLFSGPTDGDGRRSIYLKMSIMDPPKFLVCFNLPDLKLPTGRRDVTNNPTQALALLNDPLVIQLSQHWAERVVRDGKTMPEQRIHRMIIRAFGREPSDDEISRWTEAVESFAESNVLMDDKAAWAELAHLFFNTKEFLYYR